MSATRPQLYVDLDAIAANWRAIADCVAPRVAGAVVKADGYGLGAARVAAYLYAAGCREFFVATADEALRLAPLFRKGAPAEQVGSSEESARAEKTGPAEKRETGLATVARLYVFEGALHGTAQDLAAAGVVPVLNDAAQLARWRNIATTSDRLLPAALHIDTGMSRAGFSLAEFTDVLRHPQSFAGLDVCLLMTHLACADEPEHPRNPQQLASFADALAAARPVLPGLRTSIGNSAAALTDVHRRGDLVRPGIALYGSNPFVDARALLRSNVLLREVVRLDAAVLQVRDIGIGESVGYGASFVAARALRIATVGLGYADGYLRSLSGRGWGMLGGQRVPLVGRVSMDLLTFDVTDIERAIQPGEHITVLGGGVDLDALALTAGTISYELLTRLGPRLVRTYLASR